MYKSENMYKSDYDNEPSGVKLMRLINTQSLDIAKREIKNADRMCLYRTGDYWHGFEHSAYFLSRIFPKAKAFVVNHPNFPFAIVGVSVGVEEFKRYQWDHDAVRSKGDYVEYEVNPSISPEYGDWHTNKVKLFTKDVDGLILQDRDVSRGINSRQ